VSNELERVARALTLRSDGISRACDDLTRLVAAAIEAAALRALASVPDADARVIPQSVVFTLEGESGELTGLIRTRAYPIADPLGAALDFSVQGASTVTVAVDVFDGPDRAIAAANVQCIVRSESACQR
jgi:hypothetical protein